MASTRVESVDFFYVAMPEIEDVSDGSQDACVVRVAAGGGLGGSGTGKLVLFHELKKELDAQGAELELPEPPAPAPVPARPAPRTQPTRAARGRRGQRPPRRKS